VRECFLSHILLYSLLDLALFGFAGCLYFHLLLTDGAWDEDAPGIEVVTALERFKKVLHFISYSLYSSLTFAEGLHRCTV
jgi:hypothetical protein